MKLAIDVDRMAARIGGVLQLDIRKLRDLGLDEVEAQRVEFYVIANRFERK